MSEEKHSVRNVINLTQREFDTSKLPKDSRRVYEFLKNKYNEEYALAAVFTMRTAIELHRAWHMTLLTSKILQQIKDKYNLRMTWDLGVVKLRFRLDDGGYVLHRKVPYDYDSEYQDIYMRIAVALVDGHIDVYEALNYQDQTLEGRHTARSGLFLRDFPGRLLLYPFQAATCAVIFFGGDFLDAGIAAICGLTAGLVEWFLSKLGGQFKEFKILVDVFVGVSTGIIGGLFYHYTPEEVCLKSIFLGTLYWFFYGTAFVIGILEIIAGELETGVTRFVAVAVKTFVLSLGAGLGLMISTQSAASKSWLESQEFYCGTIDLDEQWWRAPLYLLCSVSVLGQYRAPIVQYWRALIVMLCGYEVQYQLFKFQSKLHDRDNLDTSSSNIGGAVAAVLSACLVAYFVNKIKYFYGMRLLQKDHSDNTKFGDFMFNILKAGVKIGACLKIGRKTDVLQLKLRKKIQAEFKNPSRSRSKINLEESEEFLILQSILQMQELNVWSILMPAVYQLVPGSIIATLWFNAIFPSEDDDQTASVFSSLMVISTSLALGLIIGFSIVQVVGVFLWKVFGSDRPQDEIFNSLSRLAGMYSNPMTLEDDPDTVGKPSDASTGSSNKDEWMEGPL